MAHKAPGKHHREGISLIKLSKMFPDDATAEKWFAKTRWPEGPHCPHCESVNVQSGAAHKSMPYRCRERECPAVLILGLFHIFRVMAALILGHGFVSGAGPGGWWLSGSEGSHEGGP